MDYETLRNMAANAARNAERICSQQGGSGSRLPFQNYSGYPFYIDEYNLLLTLTSQDDPEVTRYFPQIKLGKDATRPMCPGECGSPTPNSPQSS